MLPQITGIPLPANDNSASSSNTVALNRALPVGQNVSATVVAVSRDQVQPEIFRLRLEVNNRLIQLGVFQPLPLGQKINVTRSPEGQIQLILPQTTAGNRGQVETPPQPTSSQTPQNPATPQVTARQPAVVNLPLLQLNSGQSTATLPLQQPVTATVISSRPLPNPGNPPAGPRTGTAPPATSTSAGQVSSTGNQPTATGNTGNPAPVTERPAPAQATAQPTTQATVPQASGQTTPAAGRGEALTAIQNSPVTTSVPPGATTATQPTLQNRPDAPSAPGPNTGQAAQASAQQPPSTAKPTPAATVQPGQNQPSANISPAASDTRSAPATPVSNPPPASTVATQHQVTLLLPDGRQLQVTSNRPLPQGSELQLLRTSGNELQATRLNTATELPPSALERPAVKQALRETLPQQLPVADAFSQLTQVTARSDAGQATQLNSVVRSLLQLFGVRPGSAEAAGQIRQNIEYGGLRTESNFVKGLQPPPTEMKQQLQQLARLSEKLPTEQRERLDQLVKGLQARVTSQQINSLQQWRELPDGSFERVLQLDLPVRNGERWENLELRLSREAHHSSEGELITQWRVRLHFDLDHLGTLDAEIRLTDNQQISALFWCEKPDTAALLQQRAESFAERLRQCGFNETEINSQQGKAPARHSPVHKELIDLHT